jgi:hypothetical protein
VNSPTYMTCAELADRLRVSERTIREDWKDSILIEGRHWVKPFGRRRILFMWEQIQEDIHRPTGAALMASLRRNNIEGAH